MANNLPVQVPKTARSRPLSRDLIYFENGKKQRVTLSKRQVSILVYAWKKFHLYYVEERYSYTEFAKSFVLNGSNEMLQPGEPELTFDMLKAWLRKIRKRLRGEQLAFVGADARAMEDAFIEQMQQTSIKETLKYIHPHTPCRRGLTASLHGGGFEDAREQWKVLNGLRMLEPVEIYGRQSTFIGRSE